MCPVAGRDVVPHEESAAAPLVQTGHPDDLDAELEARLRLPARHEHSLQRRQLACRLRTVSN
jgi:hypothetical protein